METAIRTASLVQPMVHPQYIKDTVGKKMVILPQREYESIIDKIEDLEDLALYEKAKAEDNGERILFSDYLKSRGLKNG